jgi:hypothetical protein
MATLKLKILGDLGQLKKDMTDLLKKKFKIGVDSSGSDGSKDSGKESKGEKKQTSMLGMIIKKLIPLTLLLSLKPIMQAIELLLGFVTLIILYIIKFVKWLFTDFPKLLKEIWEKIVTWIKELPGKIWNLLKDGFNWLIEKTIELKDRLVEWLSGLPSRIWEFLKSLPGMIWEFIKSGFEWVKELLGKVWDFLGEMLQKLGAWLGEVWSNIVDAVVSWFKDLVDKILDLRERIGNFFSNLGDTIKEKFIELITSFKDRILNLRDKFLERLANVRDKLVDWFKNLVQNIKDLPSKIWDFMKSLPKMIADSIRSFFRIGGGSSGSRSPPPSNVSQGDDGIWRVNDAVITKDGKIIRTAPDDTIIATKNPSSQSKDITINLTFNGITSEKMMEQVRSVLGHEINRLTRF